ncbi:MAG: hypothetical protein LBU11_01040 [Zoogloeaceae bacterium]|nr:hypothetical protein [Zoogloeaceae bacterium]
MTLRVRMWVQFGEGVTAEQLWFSRQGNHLEVTLLGTEDRITFEYWYANASYQMEEFRLNGGTLLKNTQVQALVDAMRETTPPDFGAADAGMEFPVDYPQNLLELIGIQWERRVGKAGNAPAIPHRFLLAQTILASAFMHVFLRNPPFRHVTPILQNK